MTHAAAHLVGHTSPVGARWGSALFALCTSLTLGLAGCAANSPTATGPQVSSQQAVTAQGLTPPALTPQAAATHNTNGTAQNHLDAAKVALKDRHYDVALQEAQAAIAVDPQGSEAQWVLGNIYNQRADTQTTPALRQQDLASAVTAYQQAINLNAHYDAAYTNLATVYYKTGQFDNALQQVQQAIRLNPGDAISHYVLGTIYLQRDPKQYPDALSQALTEFEAAVKNDPHLGAAYTGLATVYLLKSDYVKALQNAHKGVELTQDAPDPFVYWALAQAQSANGDKAGCTQTIDKINSFHLQDSQFNQQVQKLAQQCK